MPQRLQVFEREQTSSLPTQITGTPVNTGVVSQTTQPINLAQEVDRVATLFRDPLYTQMARNRNRIV